jgi:ribonuclease P/MRP protein subunit RPP40
MLGNNVIRSSKTERDLGVVIDRTGKSTEQCILAARKANTVLGMIKRNIHFKSKDVIVRLYKALVRPRLEFCVQAWCPYLRKDIDMIERVQRRATKLIEGFKDKCYSERLSHCGLISMEKRRVRGDLIQVFKMLMDKDRADFNKFFEIQTSYRTRGHNCRIVKHRSHLDVRKYFFSQRVVNTWNSLPQSVVDADSVNSFKNRLDKFDKYFMEI